MVVMVFDASRESLSIWPFSFSIYCHPLHPPRELLRARENHHTITPRAESRCAADTTCLMRVFTNPPTTLTDPHSLRPIRTRFCRPFPFAAEPPDPFPPAADRCADRSPAIPARRVVHN